MEDSLSEAEASRALFKNTALFAVARAVAEFKGESFRQTDIGKRIGVKDNLVHQALERLLEAGMVEVASLSAKTFRQSQRPAWAALGALHRDLVDADRGGNEWPDGPQKL